jgi:hypothetical protein
VDYAEHHLDKLTDTNENAHRNLADDTRFRPVNDDHAGYYYTDPKTGERVWLSLAEALAMKAELDEAALQRADAEVGRT